MAKAWFQITTDSLQMTIEVEAPLVELPDLPSKIKALGLSKEAGELRTQIEAEVKLGERTQKVSIVCGSNDLSLIVQRLEPFIVERLN
jgi:hypothetical protein